MKKTTEISPCTTSLCGVCKQIYDKNEGVNSLQTLNPDGTHKKHCAKLNWPDDAVAETEKKILIKESERYSNYCSTWNMVYLLL